MAAAHTGNGCGPDRPRLDTERCLQHGCDRKTTLNRVTTEKRDDGKLRSVLEESLHEMVSCTRLSLGREEQTSFLVIDSQSVKNTDTAENKGWDAGKKVSGIKRHIGVDTNGLPHVIHVTTAEITDRSGALEAFTSHGDNLAGVVNVMADSTYSGEPFAASVKEAAECLC